MRIAEKEDVREAEEVKLAGSRERTILIVLYCLLGETGCQYLLSFSPLLFPRLHVSFLLGGGF